MSSFTRMSPEIKQVYREMCAHIPGAIIAGGAVRDTLGDAPIKDIDIFVSYKHAIHVKIDAWSLLGRRASKLFDCYGMPTGYTPPADKATHITARVAHSNLNGGGSIHLGNLSGSIVVQVPISPMGNLSTTKSSSYDNNRKIVEVYEAYHPKSGYLLNLIFTEVDPVKYVTDYFDFGICKAWYDGSFVNMHGDYTTDVNNKTITMTLPEEHVIACYGSKQAGINSMREHADRILWKYPGYKIVMPSV